jgi:hypothetical protein
VIRRWAGLTMAVGMLSLVAAGCGSSDSGSSGETDKGGESESARTACKKPATAKSTGLPAAFPVPGELTVTEVRKDGPTVVVDGYWTSGLDEAYKEWQEQLERAGYQVLFKEHEEHDAEISYRGSGKTGQIALRDDCTEGETTRVHITNRPA